MSRPSTLWILLGVLAMGSAAAAPAPPSRSRASSAIGAFSHELEAVASRVTPAVVQISATAYGPSGAPARVTEDLLGRERRGGSGFLISADGYIVTNAHVVEGAHRLRVMVALPPSSDSPHRSLLQPAGRWVEGR